MNGPQGKFAWTATVGEKGQIVIPKQAREIFGIAPGDTLVLLGDVERGIAILPKTQVEQMHQMMFGGQEAPLQGSVPPFGGAEE